ncbi:MAG: 3'-5' exonuclease domain-containing protein 2 [Muribaculaceae bacterium]|nr:3'-5' exonuclease domain-containing protein 2 [Muribaculaceae bacterium]
MNTLTQTIAISKDTVAELPVVNYTGKITLVDTPEKARDAIRVLTDARVVGFDTETRPSFQRGRTHNVALLQLSTEDHCYLFRLNKLGISEPLKDFLQNPEIIKIGLSVHDDFSVMRRLAPDLDPAGFIDLQEYVKYFHINDISLQKIYAIVFSEKISKQQRLTNWEAEHLTENQQKYAALDAWACLRLYRTLRSGRFHPDESPYIVDRCQLCSSQNNQLIGPKQAAEHAAALKRAEEKQAAQIAMASAAKEAAERNENTKTSSGKKKTVAHRKRAASTHRSRKTTSGKNEN